MRIILKINEWLFSERRKKGLLREYEQMVHDSNIPNIRKRIVLIKRFQDALGIHAPDTMEEILARIREEIIK